LRQRTVPSILPDEQRPAKWRASLTLKQRDLSVSDNLFQNFAAGFHTPRSSSKRFYDARVEKSIDVILMRTGSN
jgi:hypothetical protein